MRQVPFTCPDCNDNRIKRDKKGGQIGPEPFTFLRIAPDLASVRAGVSQLPLEYVTLITNSTRVVLDKARRDR